MCSQCGQRSTPDADPDIAEELARAAGWLIVSSGKNWCPDCLQIDLNESAEGFGPLARWGQR